MYSPSAQLSRIKTNMPKRSSYQPPLSLAKPIALAKAKEAETAAAPTTTGAICGEPKTALRFRETRESR